MYFVCKACKTSVKVAAEKLPPTPVKYTCKACGASSVVQENLVESLPETPVQSRPEVPVQSPQAKETMPEQEVLSTITIPKAAEGGPPPRPDTTVFHCLSEPSAIDTADLYRLACKVTSPDGMEREFTFEKSNITIGRGETDIPIDDPLVSRVHAEVERIQDQIIIKDLDSTNGTYVNENQVTVHIIKKGDLIRTGNTLILITAAEKSRTAG